MSYRVSASGYQWQRALPLEAGPADHEIKLAKLKGLEVSGTVLDASTLKPIESFRVLVSTNFLPPINEWRNFRMLAEGKSGQFQLRLENHSPRYAVKVEADGYLPDAPRVVEFNGGDHLALQFALPRSSGVSGRVLLPDGRGAAGARVALYYGRGHATMDRPGELDVRSEDAAAVKADDSGRFSFQPVPGAHSIAATHPAGIAIASVKQPAEAPNLVLQPWGAVEGTLRVGAAAAASEPVMISTLFSPPDLRFRVHYQASTDAAGTFAWDRLPPGEYRIVRVLNPGEIGRGLQTQMTPVVVRGGETTRVTVGGVGRPLMGRIAVPGADGSLDWKLQYTTLELRLPDLPEPTDREARMAWLNAFYGTDEGKARLRAMRTYDFRVAPDGSFRIDDVSPGTYLLTVRIEQLPAAYDPSRPNSIFGRREERGRLVQEVTIPGEPSNHPHDLGTLTVSLNR